MTKVRIIRFFAATLTVLAFVAIFWNDISAQKGRDNFSHRTSAHRQINCSSCHKSPTSNWVSARGYPDIADYPDHDSCVQCHRSDFFRGNRPTICAICHTAVGPRGKERFEFPVRSRSQEFETIFPHDAHQNIIAANDKQYEVGVAHFVNANFRTVDENRSQFNNCAICHPSATVLPIYTTYKPLKTEPAAVPAQLDGSLDRPFLEKLNAAYFKEMPNNHASCFNCHYQGQKPIRTDCASCHRLTSPYFESSSVQRFSLKFPHLTEAHAKKDCAFCHVRITQVSDLRNLVNADVPLMTCSSSSCHGGAGAKETDIKEIKYEIRKRKESETKNQPVFQCNYCHTAAIGTFRIPESHWLK